MKIPEGKVLLDPHAHFHKNLDANEIVEAMFDKGVEIQAICDYEKSGAAENYSGLTMRLRSDGSLRVSNPGRYSTRIRRGNQRLILFQGREIESFVEGSNGGFLHKQHEMHIVVYGIEPSLDEASEILKQAKMDSIPGVIAHPFTIPAKKIYFWYANIEERDKVMELAKNHNARLEGFNSTNTLWMAVTNWLVQKEARENQLERILIGATDAHARPDIELTRQQIGIAGTLIKDGYMNELWDASDGDFLKILNKALDSGEIYGQTQNPILFYRVMVAPRLGNLF